MLCNMEVVDRLNVVYIVACIFSSMNIYGCKLACAKLFVYFLIGDVFQFY